MRHYLIEGATEKSLSCFCHFHLDEMVLRNKLLSYALIHDNEFGSLTNFKNSYLTYVVVSFARQI